MLPDQVTQVSAYLTLGPLALAPTVGAFLAGTLQLNASAVIVNDLALAPGATIGPGSSTVNMRADITAAPASSNSAPQVRSIFVGLNEADTRHATISTVR